MYLDQIFHYKSSYARLGYSNTFLWRFGSMSSFNVKFAGNSDRNDTSECRNYNARIC